MKQLFVISNLCGLLLFVGSCSSSGGSEEGVPLVKIDTIRTSVTVDEVNYPGIVKAGDNLALAFKVSGQLESVLDREGTPVKKGDLIASLDTHDYKVRLSAAEAAWSQAKTEFERITELYEAQTMAPNDFEKARAAFIQVESKYQSAKDALSYTRLYAPFDGYIHDVYHCGGEIVQTGTPIVGFIGRDNLEIEINIPVRDYKRLQNLKEAKILLGDSIMGIRMKSVSRQANANQLYKMRFTFSDIRNASTLTAGMNCRVILSYDETGKNSVRIPLSAICKRDQESCVWRVDERMKVSMFPVHILKIDRTGAIVSGLADNERIVVTGVNGLSEGQTVEKMPAVSKTNIGNML